MCHVLITSMMATSGVVQDRGSISGGAAKPHFMPRSTAGLAVGISGMTVPYGRTVLPVRSDSAAASQSSAHPALLSVPTSRRIRVSYSRYTALLRESLRVPHPGLLWLQSCNVYCHLWRRSFCVLPAARLNVKLLPLLPSYSGALRHMPQSPCAYFCCMRGYVQSPSLSDLY